MKMMTSKPIRSFATAAFIAFFFTAPGQAAQRGSVSEFPAGITMGVSAGELPPPGLYAILKESVADADGVNGSGAKTGAKTFLWSHTVQFAYVTPFPLLDASYAAFVRNIGWADLTVTQPNGARHDKLGMPDTEVAPLNLSWALPEDFHFDVEFGVFLKNGQYSHNAPITVGQNHYCYEPNFALSWLPPDWKATAHVTFDINERNDDTRYRNGTTVDIDYTLFRSFTERWSGGVVGYYVKQFTGDVGPAALNAGPIRELSVGLGSSYRLPPVTLYANLVRDVEARYAGDRSYAFYLFAAVGF
jgi:hypothetical protein